MSQVEVFFHLSPSSVSRDNGESALLIRTEDGLQVEFEILDWPDSQIEVIEGGEGPDRGWIGTGYGLRKRAPVIRIWGDVCLPNSFCFSIRRVKKASS